MGFKSGNLSLNSHLLHESVHSQTQGKIQSIHAVFFTMRFFYIFSIRYFHTIAWIRRLQCLLYHLINRSTNVYKQNFLHRNYILNCNELQWRLREKEESMRFNLTPVVSTLLKSYGTFFYDTQYFNFFVK